jgi:hypothetical protein
MNPDQNSLVKRIGYKALSSLRSARYSLNIRDIKESSIAVSGVNQLDDSYDVFWDKVSKSYDLKTVTNSKYLNWRYGDPRAGDFKIFLAYQGEDIVGYIVLRCNKKREEYPTGFIVDMLSLDDRFDVIEALLTKAMIFFDENNVNIINFLAVKDYKFDNELMKYGFFDSRWNHHIYYTLPQGIDYLAGIKSSDSNKIHYCFGDLDYI